MHNIYKCTMMSFFIFIKEILSIDKLLKDIIILIKENK